MLAHPWGVLDHSWGVYTLIMMRIMMRIMRSMMIHDTAHDAQEPHQVVHGLAMYRLSTYAESLRILHQLINALNSSSPQLIHGLAMDQLWGAAEQHAE